MPGDCDVINSVVCLAHPGSRHHYALPPIQPGRSSACHPTSASRLVHCTAANCRHTEYSVVGLGWYEYTRPPPVMSVVMLSQAICDTARAVGWAFRFQIVSAAVNVFFAAACATNVCNTIQSPCDETWTVCRGVKIQSSVMDFDIRCSNL